MAADYYEILGVSADAGDAEIKSAFRRLAREHHPDATGGDADSEHRYKEISEAYAVLSDPRKRQEYDAARLGIGDWRSPWSSPFASTIEDIFEQFFGGSVGGRERSRSRRGESIEVLVELSLEEVVEGAERTLNFERFEPCERCEGSGAEPGTEPQRCGQCQGTGQVQQARRTVLGSIVTAHACAACRATGWMITDPCTECRGEGRRSVDVEVPIQVPPGIDDGDRLRLTGEGEAGAAGGGRGDLYVRFAVTPDERFERVGDDLTSWAEIPMTTAALGGQVQIDTLDGFEEVEVPSGTQSGAVFHLKGRGVPRRRGRGRGDLIVRAQVVTPSELDDEQTELLRRLAELRGEEASKGDGLVSGLRRMLKW